MRAIWVVLFVSSLVGCVSSNAVICDDGRTCPANYTCGPQDCFSPEEMAACAGQPEGAECQTSDGRGFCMIGCATVVCGNGVVETSEVCDDGNTSSGDGCNATCSSDETCGNNIVELEEECDPPGATCSDTCTLFRCGNGIVEPGEVCDDGNSKPLDGCYFDCKSNETCGNGITDSALGEQCDDANSNEYDACGQCRDQPLDWMSLPQNFRPAATGAAATYDLARRTVVMFGGKISPNTSTYSSETWEFNGTIWTRRSPLVSPPQRSNAMMAYDAERRRVILFGGRRDTSTFNDTWAYDGITWTKLDTPVAPASRADAVLAYDPIRKSVVLFGGVNGAPTTFGDTWELVGSTWTQRVFTTTPPPVAYAGGAFDARRGVLVVYGGQGGSGPTAAVWELGPAGWTQRADGPVGRWGHRLVYDAAKGTIVSVNGAVVGQSAATNDVIDYDGTTWTPRTLTGATPPGTKYSAVAYDVEHREIAIYGGTSSDELTIYASPVAITTGDVWVTAPPAAPLESMVLYDDLRRGRVRAFGGYRVAEFAVTNAMIELSDDGWVLVEDPPDTSSYPAPRREFAGAYDTQRGVLVVFGGRASGASGLLGDTWQYDGTSWTTVTTAGPSPRFQVAMTYDSRRGVAVLFGGVDSRPSSPIYFDETWEFNGTWTLRTPATKPPASVLHSMAYDAGRGVTVLLTGSGQTWEWNGTSWTQIITPVSPPLRDRAALAYDAERQRIVLTGGAVPGTASFTYADTWEYDGTTWTQLSTNSQPNGRFAAAMSFSATRHALVLAGGDGINTPLDTWQLRHVPTHRLEACETAFDYDGDGAVGCADSECWGVCNPTCPLGAPAAQCQSTPRCGDGTCSPVENCHTCPGDCGTCTALCGDGYCDPPENTTTCPGDC